MKKTLIAICVTFLLAAPIQMASAAASTSSGDTTVKQTSTYKQGQNKWSSKKWPSKKPTTNNSQNNNSSTTPSQPSTNATDVNAFEQEVVKLTNAERTKAGLAPFQTDSKLMAAAREKSQDMQSKNYFSHTSPTFGSPFDRMKALGISYKAAGENIAKGQRTPQEVVQAWMDSPGHRANILNTNFTHIGVGYVKTGNYWTQQFIKK
ncbi:CAP domain-containing protein [Lysinibacillus sp. NPDC096418]|uniref:CAP domain-containing protein n=1 Tax=Lysinibacillus sp. NPDC096418 TaxID=3364138 RepID=UPI00381465CC